MNGEPYLLAVIQREIGDIFRKRFIVIAPPLQIKTIHPKRRGYDLRYNKHADTKSVTLILRRQSQLARIEKFELNEGFVR